MMLSDPIVAICGVVAGVVIVVVPLVFLFAKARDRSISREIMDRIRSVEQDVAELRATKANSSDSAELGKRVSALEVDLSMVTDNLESANIMKRRKLDMEG